MRILNTQFFFTKKSNQWYQLYTYMCTCICPCTLHGRSTCTSIIIHVYHSSARQVEDKIVKEEDLLEIIIDRALPQGVKSGPACTCVL